MFQLKWLWKCLKGYRACYVFALFSTVILAVWGLVNPIIVSKIIDNVIMQIPNAAVETATITNNLMMLLGSLVILTLLRTSFGYVSVYAYEYSSQGLLYKLRNELYVNMQKQDADFFNKNRTGDLMTRLTGDMDMVRHALAWVVRMFIDCIFVFLATIIYMLYTNVLFTLVLIAVTPILFLLTKKFSKTV
ncbi:MAG: ABC transporter transmembrane domain-containing protein, partial [Oscillospiraceae bacterium]